MSTSRASQRVSQMTGMFATMALTGSIVAIGIEDKPAPSPQHIITHPMKLLATLGQLNLGHQELTTSPIVKMVSNQVTMSFAEARLRAEIDKYASLPEDWDGYGAEPASRSALKGVLFFLDYMPPGIDFPKITLASSGLPSLYWDSSEFFADLEFSDEHDISLFTKSKANGEQGYFQFSSVEEVVKGIGKYLLKRSV